MIAAQTIEKVQNLNIVDVVEKYHEPTKKAGVNHQCHCPFPGHKDTHASFMVSPSKNIARCFVCDRTINGIGLVMELKNMNYPDAIRQIARDFNIQIIESAQKERSKEDEEKYKEMESLVIANSWAADWYHNQLLSKLDEFGFGDFDSAQSPGDPSVPSTPLSHQGSTSKIPYGCLSVAEDTPFSYTDKLKQTIHYIFTRFKSNIDLIKKFKIGFAPEGFSNLYDAAIKAGFKLDTLMKAGLVVNKDGKIRDYFIFRPLIIPIHSAKGRIVGFTARQMPWNSAGKDGKEFPKYINTSDTLIFKKGNVLFGLDNDTQAAIRKADKVYLVEGNLDKTGLWHIGIHNVLTKSGTALTDEQIGIILKLTKNVCLLDDGDNAGQLSMMKTGEVLVMEGANVTVITLPDKQDPDSFFISKEQFIDFEKENERDYIIDIRAIDEYNNANTVNLKKKVKQAVADMLLVKSKDDREEYIKAICKETETNRQEWDQAIKQAVFKQKNKGINLSEENEQEVIQTDQSPDNRSKHDFYVVKTNKDGSPSGLEIDERKFLLKLKSTKEWEFENNGTSKFIYFGFFTYNLSVDESEIIFVQLRDGRIKKVSINFIKRTFFIYVRHLKPYEYNGYGKDAMPWTKIVTYKEIETILIKKITTLFEEKRLILFPDKPITILQDSMDKHYTFFKNCFIVSSKNGKSRHEYEELKEGYVWDDAVLDREYQEPTDTKPGVFEKFVCDITGNEWDLAENKSNFPEKLRYRALLIAGGYLLHNYTEIQRKAVILTQGRISEDDTSEGREGKTLFVQSLGKYCLNKHPEESKTYVYVPGKDLKSDDKHKWMDLELNTTCVLYDDPPPYIQFEDLYNLAENAFKVEKKRQENIYVKARIAITTNRPLERDSGSSKARSCVIELDSIFHADYTPEDKYKHRFFRDWTGERQEEWNKFFSYVMGTMLPEYFKANCMLFEPPSKNLYRNELLQKARRLCGNTDIIFWLDSLVKGTATENQYFKLSETYRSYELYDKLLQDNKNYQDNKKLKSNFSKIVSSYFEKEGISFTADRDTKGKTWQITGGLKQYANLNRQFISDFFSNGSGFVLDDVDNLEKLPQILKAFNLKFNTNATTEQFKREVDALTGVAVDDQSEIPF
jgi:DNA primase catalytic core